MKGFIGSTVNTFLADADFMQLTSSVSFSSTTQNDSIRFSIVNDNMLEDRSEVFVISVGTAVVSVTILDNDGKSLEV